MIYDTSRIHANLLALTEAFGHDPTRILFAVKSFPAPTIISLIDHAGLGFEVSTEREYRLLPENLIDRTVSLNTPLRIHPDRFLDYGNRLQNQIDVPIDIDPSLAQERNIAKDLL